MKKVLIFIIAISLIISGVCLLTPAKKPGLVAPEQLQGIYSKGNTVWELNDKGIFCHKIQDGKIIATEEYKGEVKKINTDKDAPSFSFKTKNKINYHFVAFAWEDYGTLYTTRINMRNETEKGAFARIK